MNKLEFFKLIKEITEVSNLDELKNLVIKANNFVKENDIKKGSEEFEKFVKVIDIIKFRVSTYRAGLFDDSFFLPRFLFTTST